MFSYDDSVYEEYEVVRSSGACNMWDSTCVMYEAQALGLEDLEYFAASPEDYVTILREFGDWKEQYDNRHTR